MYTNLSVEGISVARHAAADTLQLLSLWVVGCQQEGAVPLGLPALPIPGSDDYQVQGIPQPLAVVSAQSGQLAAAIPSCSQYQVCRIVPDLALAFAQHPAKVPTGHTMLQLVAIQTSMQAQ